MNSRRIYCLVVVVLLTVGSQSCSVLEGNNVDPIDRAVLPLLPYHVALTEDLLGSIEDLEDSESDVLGNFTLVICLDDFGWWKYVADGVEAEETQLLDDAQALHSDIRRLIDDICRVPDWTGEFELAWVEQVLRHESAIAQLVDDYVTLRGLSELRMSLAPDEGDEGHVVGSTRPASALNGSKGLVGYRFEDHPAAFETAAWIPVARHTDHDASGPYAFDYPYVLGLMLEPVHDQVAVEAAWFLLPSTDMSDDAWKSLPEM